MRALRAVCALVVLLSIESPAQSFTFVPDDTALTGPLGTEIVFNVTITNTSTQVLTLVLVRTLNNLPQSWESSMCLSVCYPPSTDSILTTSEYGSSPLNPGETRPFSLHVYTATNNGTGTVRIVARNTRDNLDQRIVTFHATSTPVSVGETPETPSTFVLEQNFPNPFNPVTNCQFSIVNRQLTILKVHDVLGREVTTLVNEVKQAGTYSVQLDGNNLSSGVYFLQLTSAGLVATRRMILMR